MMDLRMRNQDPRVIANVQRREVRTTLLRRGAHTSDDVQRRPDAGGGRSTARSSRLGVPVSIWR